MITARESLRGVSGIKDIYTSADITGLGKNFLTEKSRNEGIDSYTFFIQYYALLALMEKISKDTGLKKDPASAYESEPGNSEWEFVRGILASEQLDRESPAGNLSVLIRVLETVMKNTERSKEKDDFRGRRIIDDYDCINVKAGDDGFIREAREATDRSIKEIEKIMEKFDAPLR